jgi:hypothetical protein
VSNALPASTNAIRAYRALKRPPDERWVQWATSLLVAGTDTPSLRIVAGLIPPFDDIEVTRRVDAALTELLAGRLADPADAVESYTGELLRALVAGKAELGSVLREVAEIGVERDYQRSLMPFYLLHHACEDLRARGVQHYWDGATPANIETICPG